MCAKETPGASEDLPHASSTSASTGIPDPVFFNALITLISRALHHTLPAFCERRLRAIRIPYSPYAFTHDMRAKEVIWLLARGPHSLRSVLGFYS